MEAQPYVVVTTNYRGVFFGRLVEQQDDASVTLAQAQNCLSWDSSLHGVLGLAAHGPNDQCRIGPAVPKLTLYAITAVIECADGAIAKWKAEPWR